FIPYLLVIGCHSSNGITGLPYFRFQDHVAREKKIAQGTQGSMIPTHPVYAAPRGSRRRTYIKVPFRRAVWRPAECGAREDLIQPKCATVNISPNIVRVVSLQLRGVHGVTGNNEIAKTRCKAF